MNQNSFWSALPFLLLSISGSYAGADDALPDFNEAVQGVGVPPQVPCDPLVNPQDDSQMRWVKAGFKNANIEIWTEAALYPASSRKGRVAATHGIKLTAVLFRNTGWTKDEVQARFRRLAAVYMQCGIKVQRVELVEADALNGWIDVDGDPARDGDKESTIMGALPISDRPVFFYVRSDKAGVSAYAQPEYWVGADSPRLDTIWITRDVIPIEKTCDDPSFSTEAHELGHTLGNCGHVGDGSMNFLASRCSLVNDKIRKDQCATMKKHKSVRPL